MCVCGGGGDIQQEYMSCRSQLSFLRVIELQSSPIVCFFVAVAFDYHRSLPLHVMINMQNTSY